MECDRVRIRRKAISSQRVEQVWETLPQRLNLPPVPLPSLHCFDRLPSTNQTLWELLERGEPSGTAVVAAEQTAGRGQWGRSWSSASGGLYLSWSISPNLPLEKALLLTISSAWGIATVLGRYCKPEIPIQIKWPNDLILASRKLGGILTETRIHQQTIAQGVIGVGINWSNAVPEPGISLKRVLENRTVMSGFAISSLEELLALTLRGLMYGEWAIANGQGERVVAGYNQRLIHVGQSISIDETTGIIRGITETGQLNVELSTSQRIFLDPGQIRLGYPGCSSLG
ncbi:biotin--[acetyl-CoA-carboxylase] ligase [Roseofilum casamattae]|nr:biotin--[acetyl-CoA-carboxylase] ligase [Roseofilum casamattae]